MLFFYCDEYQHGRDISTMDGTKMPLTYATHHCERTIATTNVLLAEWLAFWTSTQSTRVQFPV